MDKFKILSMTTTKNNIDLDKYKKAVLENLKNEFKNANAEFVERLNKYIKTQEFKEDVQRDYDNGATVSACIYNIYIYVCLKRYYLLI